jgi:tetratricopeptide (TPR) repeat protein
VDPIMSDPDTELAWSTEVLRGWRELELQRPLAAWARWQRVLREDPENRAAKQALERLENSRELPEAARCTYRFRSPRLDRRAAWDALISRRNLADLSLARETFQELADGDPTDAPARWNLALCLAWQGHNREAIPALDEVVGIEASSDDTFDQAVKAWTLAAVLRQGAGAEVLSDDLDHTLLVDFDGADTDPLARILCPPGTVQPVAIPEAVAAAGEDGEVEVEVYEWLDRELHEAPSLRELDDVPVLLATVFRTSDSMRLTSPRTQGLLLAEQILKQRLSEDVRFERISRPLPIRLMDAAPWTIRLPGALDAQRRHEIYRAAIEQYYETVWIAIPQHALALRENGSLVALEPREAARRARENAALRAKLTAVVEFREQLGRRPVAAGLYAGYPFDRLRNRLGLEPHDASLVDESDPFCLNEAQLRALDLQSLHRLTLWDAFRSSDALGGAGLAAPVARRLAEVEPASLVRDQEPSLGSVLFDDAAARSDWDEARRWSELALDAAARWPQDETGRPGESLLARLLARKGTALAHLGDSAAAERALLDGIEASRDAARAALAAARLFQETGDIEHAREMAKLASRIAMESEDSNEVAAANELIEELNR